ncbi:hypothetical protein F441_23042 [Phytophthora nicotianae CJ01A1]|uniref:Uncharacterized protein n=2 Tax=Phytophthora nicotianae TaxID=4792 RepID=W2VQ46_PHYNI|nr:hypothetical protein L917_14628 [Phytophthora nicotianae]ETO99543.1 hypothetical protein F441_23042 [Phytophthora nicotianae CJ01A1]
MLAACSYSCGYQENADKTREPIDLEIFSKECGSWRRIFYMLMLTIIWEDSSLRLLT